jgi:ribose/xylose/arabinose/galactoside ABC-type transport system permease subunit
MNTGDLVCAVLATACVNGLICAFVFGPPDPIARIMGEPVVPLSVKLAAIGLLAIGLLIGFVAGLITGWCARERR